MSTLIKVRDTANNKNVYLTVDGSGQLSVKDAGVEASQSTMIASLSSIESAVGSTLLVDGSSTTQPVSAASLPLPSGAATAGLQGTAIGSLASIDSALAGTLSVSSGISRAASTLNDAASITASDTSVAIDMSSYSKFAVYGESSDNTQYLTIQISDDSTDWYDSKDFFYANGSNGHYHGVHKAVTKYARIKYSNTATETTKITKYN